jgi:hypothetical protein
MLPEAKLRPVPEGAGNNNPKADSWEDFSYYIRCISRGVPGSIFPVIYGNGQQIVQGKGFVTIMQEMVHEARVIPTDGRPHASTYVRSYMGDPRGHWEGNTLVVDVANNNDKSVFDMAGHFHSDALHVVERFTPIDRDTINYEETVEDPKVFTRPWKMHFLLKRAPADYQFLESGCFEGERDQQHLVEGLATLPPDHYKQ